ncbi:hybrid sensor histidine kinase/response regulator [Pseudomonas syringae pv. actinidiae]|nr:hybrid sensor histidine kinase/response regulator [Pseudomonas syringae pv. actinidiae]
MLSEIQAKLLIVDDLPENLLALEALIKRADRIVYKALSADEALSLLLQHEFALAILDVQMPGMNGFELAEMMRSTEKTKSIPIVFVSAAGRELNYAFKGYESGAVDFLHKPLDIHAVKSKVNVFVDLYRQRKAVKMQVEELERSRQEQEVLLKRLQSTQGELEHAIRMRDDFMSIVSHEVRTPLNGLILETQLRKLHLAKDNESAFTMEKLRAMVDRDERQIQSLIRLIEDMLDVSRIRTGKLSIRSSPFDLSELVSQLLESFAAQIAAANSTIRQFADGPVIGVWDEFRIEQVVANLLTNALNFAPPASEIRVMLNRQEDGSAHLSVEDAGPGIDEKQKARLFERFYSQGHSNGAGLGLAIVDMIVRKLESSLHLRNSAQGGLCAELRLKSRTA